MGFCWFLFFFSTEHIWRRWAVWRVCVWDKSGIWGCRRQAGWSREILQETSEIQHASEQEGMRYLLYLLASHITLFYISSVWGFVEHFILLLGPFYGAIAVLSVTRCRCRCRCGCGHRFYIAIHQVSLLN